MLTHVVAGLGYGLGFAKQKCREAMQPRNLDAARAPKRPGVNRKRVKK